MWKTESMFLDSARKRTHIGLGKTSVKLFSLTSVVNLLFEKSEDYIL